MGGCMSSESRSNSRMELSDPNSNLFRVTNVDDNGVAQWSGHLTISRNEITLYRKNLEPTRWPLKCLRRYGYDIDCFSFEVGRRCATGEGIYAFKCRGAETLYQTLENYIQTSTVGDDVMGLLPNSNSIISRTDASSPMSTLSNQNSTTNNMIGSYILPNSRSSNTNNLRNVTDDQRRSYDASDSNYLEPIANRAMPHFHTLPDGTIVVEAPLSPGSPSSLNNILEVTSLNPLPNTGLNNNGVSNVYLEFDLRGNNTSGRDNCVKKLSLDIPPQEYAPTVNFSSSNNEIQNPQVIANENKFNGNQTNLPHSLPVSPTQSNDASDTIPTYVNVNVTPGEISSTASTPKVLLNDYRQNQIFRNNANNNNYLVDSSSATHCYENLEPNEVRPILLRNRRLSRTEMLAKADSLINSPTTINENISEPSTPNNGSVNYIVLDLDQSHSQTTISSATATASNLHANTDTALSSQSSPIKNANATISYTMSPSVSASTHSVLSLMLPDSPQRKEFDYVTIDFNKTHALSNSIAPSTTTECEGLRKTRHSSNVLPNVPPAVAATNTASSHSNSVSD
ncbi:fibroblast growth factor receptor substrate 2 [Contarinia nasturtii]|uniref:fibroblast growth factor receptor substrate 2 n=1 Tax=Contarinia nasturtii TaxID=265458 RepID=UPI0012D472DA|nr:fibroblast growth factor receptor substrate 2 [Contarinia nasturtii]